MGWETSNRRQQLPRDWNRVVARIKARDRGLCQWPVLDSICGTPGTDVDHRFDPNDHRDEALWLLCRTHHARKTSREAAAGRARRPTLNRPRARHPGLV